MIYSNELITPTFKEGQTMTRIRQKTSIARGVTPLYKPYGHVPPQKVSFLHRFGPKTGIVFAHFGLELRNYGSVVFQFQINKKETVHMRIAMNFKKEFCWPSNLNNDDITSVYVNMYVAFCDLPHV